MTLEEAEKEIKTLKTRLSGAIDFFTRDIISLRKDISSLSIDLEHAKKEIAQLKNPDNEILNG